MRQTALAVLCATALARSAEAVTFNWVPSTPDGSSGTLFIPDAVFNPARGFVDDLNNLIATRKYADSAGTEQFAPFNPQVDVKLTSS